jgi:Na+(H+)/acetate symporter ActP
MKNAGIIVSLMGLAVSVYVAIVVYMQNQTYQTQTLDNLLVVEFTKNGIVAPALKFEQPASVHIITDENNNLVDVQVIPISDTVSIKK